MTIKALLGAGGAIAAIVLLAWPAPREETARDAIRVFHGGSPSTPVNRWTKPHAVAAGPRGSPSFGAARPLRYAWEIDDDPPGDPGIWATPAEFAAPE